MYIYICLFCCFLSVFLNLFILCFIVCHVFTMSSSVNLSYSVGFFSDSNISQCSPVLVLAPWQFKISIWGPWTQQWGLICLSKWAFLVIFINSFTPPFGLPIYSHSWRGNKAISWRFGTQIDGDFANHLWFPSKIFNFIQYRKPVVD